MLKCYGYPFWSPEEYDLLLLETRLKTPLIELEKIIQRPHNGILQMMHKLSKYLPHLYRPELVRMYQRQFYWIHRDRFEMYRQTYVAKHAEDIKTRRAENYNSKKNRAYRLANRDANAKYLKEWKLKRQRKLLISCLKQRIENFSNTNSNSLETVLEAVQI